jgi:hypothetical protein
MYNVIIGCIEDGVVMQIRVTGEMTLLEVRQAIYEALGEIEDEFAIRHSRGAVLFINPTDGHGAHVIPRNELGLEVARVTKKGPYRSAAEELAP